jgi:predicted enzyme related to lactoylglutathione lyase
LAHDPGFFVWHELVTTDVAAAAAFYRGVVGWGTQEASNSKLPYQLFTSGAVPMAGILELPDEGRRMGAMPRWIGYVGVRDVHVVVGRIKRLGGTVYVPPTDTDIGMISVVADRQSATFALVGGLRTTSQRTPESGKVGHVGWHELLAADLDQELAFYGEVFGWEAKSDRADPTYHLLSLEGRTIGGALQKRDDDPVPFWLIYFNVEDLDAAAERVNAAGGRAFVTPKELPNGLSIAHCADPQGAAFGLQGRRGRTLQIGWSTEWGGFSSRGQLVTPKPRGGPAGEDSSS